MDNWDTNSGSVPKAKAKEERGKRDWGEAPRSAAAGRAEAVTTRQSVPKGKERA